MFTWGVGASLLLGLVPVRADEGAPIRLHYNPRPPYLVLEEGQLKGLTGGPASAAFKAAGLRVQLTETPALRQLEALRANEAQECAVGWFRNPERELFARFSKAIYRDRPQVAVVRAEHPMAQLRADLTLAALFKNPDLTLLVKSGYSYGAVVDVALERLSPKRAATTEESRTMLRRIHQGVADYMLMAPEEFAPSVAGAGFAAEAFRAVTVVDMPQGEQRYILCSLQVPEATMRRLDAVLPRLRTPK